VLNIPTVAINQILTLCGKNFELLAASHKESSLPYNFLGSLFKNYGAAGVNFEKPDKIGLIGAGIRTLSTTLDDFLIEQSIFSEHHLTKISDALYTGYLFANIGNENNYLTSLAFGGLFWTISKIMGSGDNIQMERTIAQDTYDLAAKIDQMTQGSTGLVNKLYLSNVINAALQTGRMQMNEKGLDFGSALNNVFNGTSAYLLGNSSAENFKIFLQENLLEEGPLGNKLKFEAWKGKNPEKALELSNDISQTFHIMRVLPLKYQATTLSDSIAASSDFGLVFKALNNLFNFNQPESLSDLSRKTHKRQEKLHKFQEAVKKGDFTSVAEQVDNQLEPSESDSFWHFCKKIFENIAPIAVTSYLAGVIENAKGHNSYHFMQEDNFIGKKHISPLLLSCPGLIKGLIDEHTGNPIALDNLIDLLDYNY
jgi:hypothetical protein